MPDVSIWRRTSAAWLATLFLLAIGYLLLWRGGTTLPAMLLVAAYVVVVPFAILRSSAASAAARRGATSARRNGDVDGVESRSSYIAAAIVAVLVLALYVTTLAPSTAMWDTSEYITAAYVLGIPHPPGNPFFVLIGHVFSQLPIAPTVAQRVNLLAAVCSALSAGAWYLVAERVLVSLLPRPGLRRIGAGLAALLAATAFTVWNQSVVNEKVYTVSLLFFAAVSWLMVRWSDEEESASSDALLLLVAYLLGLGYANHPAGMLVAPAVGIAVLARRWTTLLRWRLLLAGALVFVIGLTPFAVEPIRAAHAPPMNQGETSACIGEIEAGCMFSGETYRRLMSHVQREQYGGHSVAERQAPLSAQFGMWWLYFKWQWMRDATVERPFAQTALALVFLALGLYGGVVHYRSDRRSFWFFGALVFSVTLALVVYMNFKYGWSQAPELGYSVPREVRDRDYFYIWSYSTWGVWAALGLAAIWAAAARRLGTSSRGAGTHEGSWRPWLLASPVLLLALVPLVANWRQASRAGDTATADFARDLLNSVEPYGVLVTVGDNDTFPLWYAQEVEGVRRDVTIAVTSLLNTDWYARQTLIRRPQHEYDAARGPAVYRGRQWSRPQSPPLSLTVAQADAVPLLVPLPGRQLFAVGTLNAILDPQRQPYGGLERADIFVLQMIKDGLTTGRSVYISTTTGDYAERLGLGAHVLQQGLARKVVYAPTASGRDTIVVQGAGAVDVERSLALWSSYDAPTSIIRHGQWIDQPSVTVPYAYIRLGAVLGDALQQRGDRARAGPVLATAARIATAVGLDLPGLQGEPAPAPGSDAPAPESIPLLPNGR
jgi:hypothetical protein